jgi:hypothetical protein
MKFYTYWFYAMMGGCIAGVEKFVAGEDLLFWLCIGCAFIFWVCAFGQRKGVPKDTKLNDIDDNPF